MAIVPSSSFDLSSLSLGYGVHTIWIIATCDLMYSDSDSAAIVISIDYNGDKTVAVPGPCGYYPCECPPSAPTPTPTPTPGPCGYYSCECERGECGDLIEDCYCPLKSPTPTPGECGYYGDDCVCKTLTSSPSPTPDCCSDEPTYYPSCCDDGECYDCLYERLREVERDLEDIKNDIDQERDEILDGRDRDCETLTEQERDRLDELDELERQAQDALYRVRDAIYRLQNGGDTNADEVNNLENERDEIANDVNREVNFNPPMPGFWDRIVQFVIADGNWWWLAIIAGALILMIIIIAVVASKKKRKSANGSDLKDRARTALNKAFTELSCAGSMVTACDTNPTDGNLQVNAMNQLTKTDTAMQDAEKLVDEFLKSKKK